jgi:hypothetical protein
MGWGIPPYPYRYPLPPPVSPLIYRVFTLSNRGDNAPTEIFPGFFLKTDLLIVKVKKKFCKNFQGILIIE